MDKFDIKINSLRWGNCPMNALDDKKPNDKIIIDRIITDNKLERQPDIHLHISVPNEFSSLGKYNIGVTAGIENTAPKVEWIQGMNKMNMNKQFDDSIMLLFDQALLVSNIKIENPGDFINRMNKVLEKSL